MATQNEVSVSNMALKRVGRNLGIVDMNEDSAEARACLQFFAQARQFLLRLTTPGFARVSAPLTVTDQTPRPGYDFEYEYPNESLNFLGLINQADPIKGKRPACIKGRNSQGRTVIWTNEELAWGEWIADVTNANEWDTAFIELMVAFLAFKICLVLTQDKNTYTALNSEVQTIIFTTKALDAGEDRRENQDRVDWLESRN